MTDQKFVFTWNGQLSVSIPVLFTLLCSRSFQLIWFPGDNVAIYLGVDGGVEGSSSHCSHCWFKLCNENTSWQKKMDSSLSGYYLTRATIHQHKTRGFTIITADT